MFNYFGVANMKKEMIYGIMIFIFIVCFSCILAFCTTKLIALKEQSNDISFYNYSCSAFKINDIYGFTKERKQNTNDNITFIQTNDYILYGNGGINKHGVFIAQTSINAINDTKQYSIKSNFSIGNILLYCSNITDVLYYIDKNPICYNCNMLICYKNDTLKIQSLCGNTIIIQTNNSYEYISNYPFIANDIFKIRNHLLFANSLIRKYNLENIKIYNISNIVNTIWQTETNNLMKYNTIFVFIVYDNTIYIYDSLNDTKIITDMLQ